MAFTSPSTALRISVIDEFRTSLATKGSFRKIINKNFSVEKEFIVEGSQGALIMHRKYTRICSCSASFDTEKPTQETFSSVCTDTVKDANCIVLQTWEFLNSSLARNLFQRMQLTRAYMDSSKRRAAPLPLETPKNFYVQRKLAIFKIT